MSGEIATSAPRLSPSGQGNARAREGTWRLEPHCCRVCFGRVVSRRLEDGSRLYQCSCCGAEASGHKPDVVCACGLKLRKSRGDGRTGERFTDAGIRCHENRNISPEFPALYVCSYGAAQSEG